MLANKKITSLVFMSLAIQELSVHLHGKGSHALVNAEAAEKSVTLKDYIRRGWVKVETIRGGSMPCWPFYPTPKVPEVAKVEAPPEADQPPIRPVVADSTLVEIRDLLKSLVLLQSQGIRTQQAFVASASSNSHAPVDDIPKYIPSSILPQTAEVSLKTEESVGEKSDIESSLDALRRLRNRQ